ncbi:MAG: phosphomannomutase/phosphoglucomutase [Alphaproteobacteria bacterium]|nr:phosphomannomutase/phosphoglucomutase [Alphaproteobacteria bacterium]
MSAEKGYSFSPVILREYDIRGQIDKNLSETDAYYLGRAFGSFVAKRGGSHVCVGYDGRETSPLFCEHLIKGLVETGLRVENIGLGPSPMLYFAVKSRKADAGIMITGSHNPADYNGFKMMLLNEGVYGPLIQEIGNIAANGDFIDSEGSVEAIDIRDEYIARILQDLTNKRPLKIAWDAGNGAAGEVLQRLVKKLPGEHTLLFEDIDGTFPNHHPDPTVDKNLVDLQAAVAAHNCDLGIAFDGDGDRIGVVDENGSILRCDILMTIYAREVLAAHPGAPIIGDVKCSQVMFDEIDRMGGQGVMWKTGHSLVKAKMAELSSPLAGELSGHIFFADKYYGYDDALYCAVRLINALADDSVKLSDLTKNLPQLFSTPEIRIDVDEAEKFALPARVLENVKTNNSDNVEISDIDGLRVSTDEGWWLLRASNTQDVLVVRAESHSQEGLQRLQQTIIQEVEKIGYRVTF